MNLSFIGARIKISPISFVGMMMENYSFIAKFCFAYSYTIDFHNCKVDGSVPGIVRKPSMKVMHIDSFRRFKHMR